MCHARADGQPATRALIGSLEQLGLLHVGEWKRTVLQKRNVFLTGLLHAGNDAPGCCEYTGDDGHLKNERKINERE
jgi:hypothetical protein